MANKHHPFSRILFFCLFNYLMKILYDFFKTILIRKVTKRARSFFLCPFCSFSMSPVIMGIKHKSFLCKYLSKGIIPQGMFRHPMTQLDNALYLPVRNPPVYSYLRTITHCLKKMFRFHIYTP